MLKSKINYSCLAKQQRWAQIFVINAIMWSQMKGKNAWFISSQQFCGKSAKLEEDTDEENVSFLQDDLPHKSSWLKHRVTS